MINLKNQYDTARSNYYTIAKRYNEIVSSFIFYYLCAFGFKDTSFEISFYLSSHAVYCKLQNEHDLGFCARSVLLLTGNWSVSSFRSFESGQTNQRWLLCRFNWWQTWNYRYQLYNALYLTIRLHNSQIGLW